MTHNGATAVLNVPDVGPFLVFVENNSQKVGQSLVSGISCALNLDLEGATIFLGGKLKNDNATLKGNHHFRDKGALLYALLARLSESFRATTRDAVDPARWQGATIADVLRGYLEFSLDSGRSRPGLQRATLEATLRDPDLRAHFEELRDELARGLTALLLARRREIGHPDPELAIAFVLDQLGAILRARLDSVLFHAPLAACSDERFVAETIRGVCGYLQIDPTQDLENPARPPPSSTASS